MHHEQVVDHLQALKASTIPVVLMGEGRDTQPKGETPKTNEFLDLMLSHRFQIATFPPVCPGTGPKEIRLTLRE